MPFEIDLEDPRIGFASAHFIIDHEKCGRLHGHNYFLRVTLRGELDEQNMVLDYGPMKEILRKLTKKIDHRLLVPGQAPDLSVEEGDKAYTIRTCNKRWVIPKEDVVVLPIPATTSEELARYFYFELKKIWPQFAIKVSLEEAPGASASYFE